MDMSVCDVKQNEFKQSGRKLDWTAQDIPMTDQLS